MLLLLRERITHGPCLSAWQALVDYLLVDMAGAPVERVRVLHLNAGNRLIRDELICEGTIDEAPVFVREVIRRALELGSAAIILVHNHPSGDPAPSRADINMTRSLAEAARLFRIAVHDHIIIAGGAHTSLRSRGVVF